MASHYLDVTEDWEACLTQTYYTVPLTSYLDKSQEAGRDCATEQFTEVNPTACTLDELPCVLQLQTNCLSAKTFTVSII